MTDYTTIPDGDIDQDSPVTQPLLSALRDNPLAIREGNTTAPKVQAQAIDCVAFDRNGGTFTCPSGTELGFIDYVCIAKGTSGTSGTTVFRYRTSDDSGSTWSAWTDLVDLTAGSPGIDGEDTNVGIASLPSGTNAIECKLQGSGFSATYFNVLLRAYGGTAV